MKQFFPQYFVDKTIFALLLIVSGFVFSSFEWTKAWDCFFYDALSTSSARTSPDNIVIIAIDEASLAQFGRWPWPRSIHAPMIDKLTESGAKVIGIDIIFSEPDRFAPEEDAALAAAIAHSGRVILPVLHEQSGPGSSLQLTLPLPALEEAAAGLGHIDTELDADGIMRRAYLKAGLGKPDWPAFSLAMLEFTGSGVADLPGIRNKKLKLADRENWVRDYQILVPFAGPPGHFQRISYADFLKPSFDTSAVHDKFIFVGTTAIGMGDALPTPVSGETVPMPGVEFNATLLDTLQRGIAVEPLAIDKRLILTGLLILLPLVTYPRLRPRQTLLATFLFLGLTCAISILFLKTMHRWYVPSPTLFTLALSYPLWTWRRFEATLLQLFHEKEQAGVILHAIGDGVITTDIQGRVQYMNPVAEQLSGFQHNEATGLLLEEIFSVSDVVQGNDFGSLVRQCLREKKIIQFPQNSIVRNRFGNRHTIRATAGPLHNETGKSQGVVVGIHDITETQEALQQIAYQATHDALTGLPNRALLLDRLQHAIASAYKTENHIAVLLIDLDHFKKANDRLGHTGGDLLLKEIGTRLQACCRREDTVARLGGDEFVILMEDLAQPEAAAEVANNVLHALDAPFQIEDQEIFISGSIGASVFPKDGVRAETLLKNADTAMYRAKKIGRNDFHFFSRKMNDVIQERLDMEKKLRSAVNNNDLQLYYQPQIRLADGMIIGVEALLRWKNSEGDFISPKDFIPVAEECGLIHIIGEWVLQTACEQAKTWQKSGLPPIRMAVNLSAMQFINCDILNIVTGTIDNTMLPAPYLELEITEGLIIQDIERCCDILGKFRELGGKVSIDDFGTGYSSLAYLKELPIDQLKIDAYFVRDITTSKENAALTQAIITMGHGMGLEVVAEGVETESQLSLLKEQQCDIVQGFLFARPLPAEELNWDIQNVL